MKKTLLAATLLFVSAGAFAQENGNRDASNKIVRGPYETNRFGDNWFIEAGAGASIYLGGQNGGSFGSRIRPVFDISLGKWITPSVGVRLQYNSSPSMRQYSGVYASPYTQIGSRVQKFNFSNLHADFMWNLSNAIGGYKEDRVYSVIPYMGVGWSHITYSNAPTRNEVSFNFGIVNKFRLSQTVDINLEMRSTMMHGGFDASSVNNQIDLPVAVTAGVTIRLGKVKGFSRVKVAAPADYSSYNNRIKTLESDNTTLSGQNKQLAEENQVLRNRKPEPVVVESTVSASPVALFFALGKSTLDKKELTNLDFYVKNAIKLDKNKKFTLTGSADSATGNKEVNQRISEARMQYVYDLLVNKYGVSKERLIKKAEGDSNNRFAEPELNRTVIVE